MQKNITHYEKTRKSVIHMNENFGRAIASHFRRRYRRNTDSVMELKNITRKNDIADFDLFSHIEQLCFDMLNGEEKNLHQIAADILLGCISQYYECVGLFQKAFEIESRILSYSIEANNTVTQRRAHNCLSARYARFCDFGKACHHIEKACALANASGNQFHLFASLVNAVVVMESMGLLDSARKLALQLNCQSKTSACDNHLHLINSSNGMRICHELGDLESASIFYRVANASFSQCQHLTSDLTIAHFDSATIVYLTRHGDTSRALELADKALKSPGPTKNIRVKALLCCAQAEARLRLADPVAIYDSCCLLDSLLEPAKNISTHYEEILRMLVRLHTVQARRITCTDNAKAISYLRLLREHAIAVKHKIYFETEFGDLSSRFDSSRKITNPSYRIPNWIFHEDENRDEVVRLPLQECSDQVCEFNGLARSVAKLSGGRIETRMRSEQYDVAENWSVAAEVVFGFDGRHCFRVGKLSAVIALKCGFERDEAIRIDLASRLHDIGKAGVFLSEEKVDNFRPYGNLSPFSLHPSRGHQLLLGLSNNKTLLLGSKIALSHHEFWNGGGYPFGLKGNDIPIEGRICAVADTFLTLVRSNDRMNSFSFAQARAQLATMAGVQLDPDLVCVLVELIDNEFYDKNSIASRNSVDHFLSGLAVGRVLFHG